MVCPNLQRYVPWPLNTDTGHPIILGKALQLLRRQQTLNVLDIDHTLEIPIPPILDPIIQRRPQEFSLDDEVKWRRRGRFPRSRIDDLVDQFRKLESPPVGRDEVRGLWNRMGGIPRVEVDGHLVRRGRGHSNRI